MSEPKAQPQRYATATNPRALEKRKALRQALLTLLDEKPFEAITIPDITKAAGAGYTTFYRHYPGKDELLEDVATDEINKLIEMVLPILGSGQDDTARMDAALTFCGYINEHRASWSTLLTGGASNKLRAQFIQTAREIQIPQPQGQWLPVDAGVIFGVSSTIELLSWWLMQEQPISAQEFAKIYQHLVITPLCS